MKKHSQVTSMTRCTAIAIIITSTILGVMSCQNTTSVDPPPVEVPIDTTHYDAVYKPTSSYFELSNIPSDVKDIKVVDTPQTSVFDLMPLEEHQKNIYFKIEDNTTIAAVSGINNTVIITGLEKPTSAKVEFEYGIGEPNVIQEKGKNILVITPKENKYCKGTKAKIVLGNVSDMSQDQIDTSVARILDNHVVVK